MVSLGITSGVMFITGSEGEGVSVGTINVGCMVGDSEKEGSGSTVEGLGEGPSEGGITVSDGTIVGSGL